MELGINEYRESNLETCLLLCNKDPSRSSFKAHKKVAFVKGAD